MTAQLGGPPSTSRPGNGLLALVIASVLWGTTGTAASFMPPSVSPLAIGAVTMTVGGLLLFATSARASFGALRQPRSVGWLVVGALGVFVYPLAFYSAMDLAGVAIGNVVALGSGPVFAALLEWVFERRPPTRRWSACTTVAVAGIALLAFAGHPTSSRAGDADVRMGALLGLLAGLAYALYTYSSSRAMDSGQGSRAVMGGMFGIGALLLIPVLLATGSPIVGSPGALGISAYLALGPMLVAYLLFGIGLRSFRSSTVTTITLLEPVVATVLAVCVVGERLTVAGWVGIGLVLIGVAALATARHPGKTP